ncbi:2-(3-amino-3-carboxypropyl)histidine synthase subunit 2 [Euwallacea fornicatus]|uniref:2-(3-amino-3-carboxypropyl)histidine synthase subunit 2 n=1 Tax=Euwallacea fornicatus TaxID=995702 RepID=UPI00338DF9CE
MPQFSTNESVSLEKDIELKGEIPQFEFQQFDQTYEIQKCAQWIKENEYQKVCLQFPDHLLPHSTEVALKLQKILGQTVYILGDTAYESCCIDYVAAAHINADAIIHFGPICFSKPSENLPYLNVYEKKTISVTDLEKILAKEENETLVLLDDGYVHSYDHICKAFANKPNIVVMKIDDDLSDINNNNNIVFVGRNERKLMNISLGFKSKRFYYVDPSKQPLDLMSYQPDSKIIKRRYFLIEKIKDASTIGIVIGTLAVKNYLKVIERVKKLVEACGKKYYLISVGKPTVAKLANLGEIDIYVMITCAMNEIYDSRDFYKPIVTPYDIEIALNADITDLNFTYDYNRYLSSLNDVNIIGKSVNETDVSLLTGKLRSNVREETQEFANREMGSSKSQIALKGDGTLSVNSHFGAGYLNDLSWKGLEQNLGQTEVKLAEKGRTGIAQGYENEKN